MSYFIDEETNKIALTRGDTLFSKLMILSPSGDIYKPNETDVLTFSMKKSAKDEEPLVTKTIPTDTMELVLDSKDTLDLPFGKYVYDICLTTEEGIVETVVPKSDLVLTEEVHKSVSSKG